MSVKMLRSLSARSLKVLRGLSPQRFFEMLLVSFRKIPSHVAGFRKISSNVAGFVHNISLNVAGILRNVLLRLLAGDDIHIFIVDVLYRELRNRAGIQLA